MKTKIFFGLCYMIYSCIVLVVLCALPWFGVIMYSRWYLLMAIPFTGFAGVVVSEVWNGICEQFEKINNGTFDWMTYLKGDD